jgi:hypothetical protein
MSALGQKQTCAVHQPMSALYPLADMCTARGHVCFGPIADICGAKTNISFTPEIAHSQALSECPLSAKNRHGEPAERCQVKTPQCRRVPRRHRCPRRQRRPSRGFREVLRSPDVSACLPSSRRPPRVSGRPREARALSPCNAQRIVLVSPSITSRTRGGFPLAIGRPFSRKRATTPRSNVRFGSKADMCGAAVDVR